jgi:hypothetical protein
VPELPTHAQAETSGEPEEAACELSRLSHCQIDFAERASWRDAEMRAYLLLQWVPYGLEAAFSEELAAAGHYTRLQKMRSTQALDDWDAANPVTSSRERAAFTELKRLGIYTQQDYYLPSKADEQIYSKRLKEVERKIGSRAGSRGGNPQKPQSTDRARRARRRGH